MLQAYKARQTISSTDLHRNKMPVSTFDAVKNSELSYCHISVIKDNKLSNHNRCITSGIRTSCKHKRELYIELRNNQNPN